MRRTWFAKKQHILFVNTKWRISAIRDNSDATGILVELYRPHRTKEGGATWFFDWRNFPRKSRSVFPAYIHKIMQHALFGTTGQSKFATVNDCIRAGVI